MEQRTDEWFKERLGKVTASRVADVIARTKSGYSTSRANYMAELICERLTGVRGDTFQSAAILWGVEQEANARTAYEVSTGALVVETGFIPHKRINLSGASPDGLVGEEGLVEIKAPLSSTHIETLLGGSIPGKYITQMQWQMACTGRQWCDFVSYDPRLPDNMQLFIKRVPRDAAMIDQLETEVLTFLDELDWKIRDLKNQYGETNV